MMFHVSCKQIISGHKSKLGNSDINSENSLNFAGRLWMFRDKTVNLSGSRLFKRSEPVQNETRSETLRESYQTENWRVKASQKVLA